MALVSVPAVAEANHPSANNVILIWINHRSSIYGTAQPLKPQKEENVWSFQRQRREKVLMNSAILRRAVLRKNIGYFASAVSTHSTSTGRIST